MKDIFITGAFAMLLLAPEAQQDQNQPAQNAPSQKQTIPDAPRPQTTGLTGITPGKGTSSTSSLPPDSPALANSDTVPSSLPSTLPSAASDADAGPAPDLAPASTTFRNNVTLIDVPFTVKDNKGKLVPGLTWRDIRVYENGYRQKMRVFTVDPFPLSVALVIDQSLPNQAMTTVNNALGALQGAFTPYDEVSVFTYNNGVKQQTDFTAGQSPRLATVIDRSKTTGREQMYYAPGEALEGGININNGAQQHITPLGAGAGHTNGITPQVEREAHTLNDAIFEAAKATTRAGRERRRVVYVISDGKEYGSKVTSKEVIRYLQTNKIAVYATLVGDSAVTGLGFLDHIHIPLQMRDNMLPVYTAATGGETYSAYRTRSIEESFQRIGEDVRTQYTVGYYSTEPAIDGKFRKVEVRVLKPNLSVTAKAGYFPTAAAVPPPAVRSVPSATP